jgi:protein TonB
LSGGGQLEKGRATSPLPPSALTELGDAAEDAQKKVEAMQEQQTQLLAQIKKQLATLPPPDPKAPTTDPVQAEREEKRKRLIKILAEIERRINEENARPKKRYISPATREGTEAIYMSQLKDRVEMLGTKNFPNLAGNKLYGELVMVITLNAKGGVLDTEIAVSSGNKSLDRIAQAIVKAGAPYGNFTPAMLKEFQVIVTAQRFKFTRDEALETKTDTTPR